MTDAIHNPANERDALLTMLADGQASYLACLANISEEQAHERKDAASWSILECAEHVATSEGQMLRAWQKLAAPGTTSREQDQVARDAAYNREHKYTAPERSRPNARFSTLAEARDRFVENRQASIKTLQEMGDELRSKTLPHPLVGTVDGYQLFLIMALHPQRHAAQIEEIAGSLTRAAGK